MTDDAPEPALIQTRFAIPSIQGGLVKGLVIATPGPSPVLPNVPTSEEQGLPNFKATGWNLLLAPKGTPAAIADQLNAAAVAALKDEGVRKRVLDLGAELPGGSEQTRTYALELVRTEIDKWVPVIKAAGVVVN